MQEIVLFLSSIAGAATAAAYKKFPKNKFELQSLGASSQIKSQVNSLKIEKEILTKTISRLYQQESELTKIQRDKLLLRYQHQLGVILARIEKLEQASHHPDLGPVGDGLITLMDQKLSQLDKRLYDISSKINIANAITEVETQPKEEIKIKREPLKEKESIKIKESKTVHEIKKEIPKPEIQIPIKPQKSVELTTLTELPVKPIEFPFDKYEKQVKTEVVEEITTSQKEEAIQSTVEAPQVEKPTKTIQIPLHESLPEPPKQEALPEPDQKPKSTINLPEEEKLDDDEDDLDKIKGEIMKTLSKLEQAEVE